MARTNVRSQWQRAGLVSLAAVVVGLGAIVVAGHRARAVDVVTDEPREPVIAGPDGK